MGRRTSSDETTLLSCGTLRNDAGFRIAGIGKAPSGRFCLVIYGWVAAGLLALIRCIRGYIATRDHHALYPGRCGRPGDIAAPAGPAVAEQRYFS